MDKVSSAERSRIMAQVRSHHNRSTELKLLRLLKAKGLKGWRRKQKLLGNPDFTYPKQRTVLFVDGCFWHGCPQCCRMPSANRDYWLAKITRNQRRDRFVTKQLRDQGWKVIRIWEHEVGKPTLNRKLNRLTQTLREHSA